MDDPNKKRLDELSRQSTRGAERNAGEGRRRRGPYGPMRPMRNPARAQRSTKDAGS